MALTIQERVARQQQIDEIKKEISHYSEAVKSTPKFAFFYNGKIRWLENKLAVI